METRTRRNTVDFRVYLGKEKDQDGFDIRYINKSKGSGVFARKGFEKGSFLFEYKGELTEKEPEDLEYVFEFEHKGRKYWIDASKDDGSLGRMVNDDHKNPNAISKKLITTIPRIAFFALKDIQVGDEVLFNYDSSNKETFHWRKQSVEKSDVIDEDDDDDDNDELGDDDFESSGDEWVPSRTSEECKQKRVKDWLKLIPIQAPLRKLAKEGPPIKLHQDFTIQEEPEIAPQKSKKLQQCDICGKSLQNLKRHLLETHKIEGQKVEKVRDPHGYIVKTCPICGEPKQRLRAHLKQKHKKLDKSILDDLMKSAVPVTDSYQVKSKKRSQESVKSEDNYEQDEQVESSHQNKPSRTVQKNSFRNEEWLKSFNQWLVNEKSMKQKDANEHCSKVYRIWKCIGTSDNQRLRFNHLIDPNNLQNIWYPTMKDKPLGTLKSFICSYKLFTVFVASSTSNDKLKERVTICSDVISLFSKKDPLVFKDSGRLFDEWIDEPETMVTIQESQTPTSKSAPKYSFVRDKSAMEEETDNQPSALDLTLPKETSGGQQSEQLLEAKEQKKMTDENDRENHDNISSKNVIEVEVYSQPLAIDLTLPTTVPQASMDDEIDNQPSALDLTLPKVTTGGKQSDFSLKQLLESKEQKKMTDENGGENHDNNSSKDVVEVEVHSQPLVIDLTLLKGPTTVPKSNATKSEQLLESQEAKEIPDEKEKGNHGKNSSQASMEEETDNHPLALDLTLPKGTSGGQQSDVSIEQVLEAKEQKKMTGENDRQNHDSILLMDVVEVEVYSQPLAIDLALLKGPTTVPKSNAPNSEQLFISQEAKEIPDEKEKGNHGKNSSQALIEVEADNQPSVYDLTIPERPYEVANVSNEEQLLESQELENKIDEKDTESHRNTSSSDVIDLRADDQPSFIDVTLPKESSVVTQSNVAEPQEPNKKKSDTYYGKLNAHRNEPWLRLFKKHLLETCRKTEREANQHCAQVFQIWMFLKRNKLKKRCLTEILDNKTLQSSWFSSQLKTVKPGTVSSRLSSYRLFMDFLAGSLENVDLHRKCLNSLSVAKSLQGALKKDVRKRKVQVQAEDIDNMISPEDVNVFMQSEKANQAEIILQDWDRRWIDHTDFCLARDYILFNLLITNGQRPAAVLNIVNKDIPRCEEDISFTITVTEHKTGHISPAYIAVNPPLHSLLKRFVEISKCIHGMVLSANDPIFIAWPCGESHTPKRLQNLKGMQKLVGEVIMKKVTATKIRKAVATTVRDKRPELRDELASHMNHCATTADRYYHLKRKKDAAIRISSEIEACMVKRMRLKSDEITTEIHTVQKSTVREVIDVDDYQFNEFKVNWPENTNAIPKLEYKPVLNDSSYNFEPAVVEPIEEDDFLILSPKFKLYTAESVSFKVEETDFQPSLVQCSTPLKIEDDTMSRTSKNKRSFTTSLNLSKVIDDDDDMRSVDINSLSTSYLSHGRRSFLKEEADLLLKICEPLIRICSTNTTEIIGLLEESEEGKLLYKKLVVRFGPNLRSKLRERVKTEIRRRAKVRLTM